MLAKVKPLDMPQYGGDFLMYSSFKNNFDRMIRCIGTPPDTCGIQIHSHLYYSALKFVGSRGNCQGNYRELLSHIISYGDFWAQM